MKTRSCLWLALLCACSHPITITPDLQAISQQPGRRIDLNVGYYISPADLQKEARTPGGGGDHVSYSPYQDLAPAIFKALSGVFREVYAMDSIQDPAEIQANHIAYVFVPRIETRSTGGWNWFPPTWFQVTLECRALGKDGKVVWQKTCVGQGTWSHEEGGFGSRDLTPWMVAAREASGKAVAQFQQEVAAAPEFAR